MIKKNVILAFLLLVGLKAQSFKMVVKEPIKDMLSDMMEIVVDLGWLMVVILGLVGIYIAKVRKHDFPAFLGFAALAIGFWLVCLTISKKGF